MPVLGDHAEPSPQSGEENRVAATGDPQSAASARVRQRQQLVSSNKWQNCLLVGSQKATALPMLCCKTT